MVNECVACLSKYLSEESNQIRYWGRKKRMLNLESFFFEGTLFPGDSPDSYIVKNDEVLIIEHFEFDSYKKRKRKGSKARAEKARIDRVFDGLMRKGVSGTMIETIDAKSSYQSYIENLIGAFDHHYERVDTYIQNLKDNGIIGSNTKVKIMFLIENTDPLGCVYIDNHELAEISLMNCMDFLLHLKGKDKLFSVFYVATTWGRKTREIILCDDLKKYIRKSKDYSKVRYVDTKVHVVGGVLSVPLYRQID